MPKLLIIGLGDVAQRALPALLTSFEVTALTRSFSGNNASHEHLRVVTFDLSVPTAKWSVLHHSILHESFDALLWTAPPVMYDAVGSSCMKHILQMLRPSLLRMVYISTTGVYGDCQGAWIQEDHPLNPQSSQAKARVEDERIWHSFAEARGISSVILRAPGIYAPERLPLASLLNHAPIMHKHEDSFSNHIHADDLAGLLVHALTQPLPDHAMHCVVNACDDAPLLMGDWLIAIAQVLGLPIPVSISRKEMERVAPATRWRFMRESRRIRNTRLKNWGYTLHAPDAIAYLYTHAEQIRAHYQKVTTNAS